MKIDQICHLDTSVEVLQPKMTYYKKYQKWYTIDALGAIFAIFEYSHYKALGYQDTLRSQKILGSQKNLGSQRNLGSQNILGSQKQYRQYCQC